MIKYPNTRPLSRPLRDLIAAAGVSPINVNSCDWVHCIWFKLRWCLVALFCFVVYVKVYILPAHVRVCVCELVSLVLLVCTVLQYFVGFLILGI